MSRAQAVVAKIMSELKADGFLHSIDIHFADFMVDKFGGDDTHRLLFALISNSSNEGHSCFYIETISDYSFYEKYKDLLYEMTQLSPKNLAGVGCVDDLLPVIWDGERYYLHRYYQYEQVVLKEIQERSKLQRDVDPTLLKELLEKHFQHKAIGEIDWQKTAAAMTALGHFSVISGGPGTGKTTTVAKILAILIELSSSPLQIKIAAPTGKAAARLQDSIRSAKTDLDVIGLLANDIPDDVFTIHRLLGYQYGQVTFKHNKHHLLDADVVVIDEASMIDIALMSKLLEALKPDACVVLLGDKDQLASVAPGAVLSDICSAADVNHFSEKIAIELAALTDCNLLNDTIAPVTSVLDRSIQLKKSYRYKGDSDIGKLAPLINAGESDASYELMSLSKGDELSLHDLKDVDAALKKLVLEYYVGYLNETAPSQIFKRFDQFRILSGTRKGRFGVNRLNQYIESILEKSGSISLNETYYIGRPIMVTENNYSVKLFNGDVGICLFDPDADCIMVYFLQADGTFRKVSPARLPAHETVYAMTVHKSQGSEFDHVAIVLPDADSAILTRELIYTAVTRAKNNVTLFTEKGQYLAAVQRKVKRMSGLIFE